MGLCAAQDHGSESPALALESRLSFKAVVVHEYGPRVRVLLDESD